MSESHLSLEQLEAFANGRLEGQSHDDVAEHILRCDTCCDAMRSIDVSVSDLSVSFGARSIAGPELAAESGSNGSSGHGRFLPGTVLCDRYRIVSLLGHGGMGEVYRADDMKLSQPVALKFIGKELAHDASASRN